MESADVRHAERAIRRTFAHERHDDRHRCAPSVRSVPISPRRCAIDVATVLKTRTPPTASPIEASAANVASGPPRQRAERESAPRGHDDTRPSADRADERRPHRFRRRLGHHVDPIDGSEVMRDRVRRRDVDEDDARIDARSARGHDVRKAQSHDASAVENGKRRSAGTTASGSPFRQIRSHHLWR